MQRAASVVPRVAQAVVAIVTVGFFFGGFVGIMTSDLPPSRRVAPLVLLAALLALHLRNCVRRLDGGRPAGWRWTLAAQAVLTFVPMIWYSSTWYDNVGFLCGAVLLLDVLAKGRDRAPPMDPAKYESDHSWLARQ